MKLPRHIYMELYQDFKTNLEVDKLLEKINNDREMKAKYKILDLMRDCYGARKELNLVYNQEPRCFQIMMIAKTPSGNHIMIGLETHPSPINKWQDYTLDDSSLEFNRILKFTYTYHPVPRKYLQLIDQHGILVGEFEPEFDKK